MFALYTAGVLVMLMFVIITIMDVLNGRFADAMLYHSKNAWEENG